MSDAAAMFPRVWGGFRRGGWPLLLALAAFVLFLADIIGLRDHGGLFAEDDAYYYLVTAKNIAATGRSTFDGQSLTNGYHPLWMIVLVLQELTVGGSLMVTFVIEAALLSGGLYLLLRRAPRVCALACAAYALPFLVVTTILGMRGMEFSLFVFAFAALVNLIEKARSEGGGGLMIGLVAAAAIGARIDAAVFVGPLLLMAPLPLRTRLRALGVLAGLGLVFAVVSLAIFGAVTPISSAVKSLGGLQINHTLLRQMVRVFSGNSSSSLYIITIIALLASPLLWLASRQGTTGRALAAASTLGGAAFVAKLVFASSWEIWPWYNFAVFPPFAAGLYVVADPQAPWARYWPSAKRLERGVGLAVMAGILVWAGMGLSRPFRIDAGYGILNARAAARFGPILGGARVAMGDRAGSFAMAYPGGVVQLEGLMNDKAYFRALKAGGDVTNLLCRRQVKFLIDYEPELGAYETLRVSVLGPAVTQAKGPTVTVRHRDEVARMSDLAVLDTRFTGGAPDTTLYVWRLDCPAP